MSDNKPTNLDKVHKVSDAVSKVHLEYLIPICETFGYGATMDEASRAWIAKDPNGAFVVGPCKISTVPCGCKTPHKCDWCCGSGWLTKHVKSVKDKM